MLPCCTVSTGTPPKRPKGDLPFSWVLVLEIVCSVLCALTFVVDLATKGSLHIRVIEKIYGYTIVMDSVGVVSWLLSVVLLYRERVLVVSRRPHGLALALFWLVYVAWLGLQLASLRSPAWWWHVNSRGDIVDLVLFLVRAVILVLLVVLGLLRPLCCPGRRRAYALIINAESAAVDVPVQGADEKEGSEARKRKEGDFVKKRTTSAFSDIWLKVRLLFPYVWPKGEFQRQMCL